ncbi:MAG: TerB family tellurite resistance protein [Planctomycetes bacterium]|nr:TerB family tellurite resistance protein [Planctomycetota bacterium]
MPDRNSIQYWLGRFALGVVLLLAAGTGIVQRVLHIPDRTGLITVGLGLYGFHLALSSSGPMVRLLGYRSRTHRQWSDAAQAAWQRASLPRRIFYLLAAVADADGPMTQAEREVVRQFLLERFADPVSAHEIANWEMQPLLVQDRVGLAARIAVGLDGAELDTLFCWCTLVAFADGRFRPDEHAALHEVARGLGIVPQRARMLFHLARAQWMMGQRTRSTGGGSGGSRQQRPAPPPSMDARAQALETLGLDASATPEQVRKRHRELVRKFHPDAQPNLGPVAMREATERFTAIQRAYETLTAAM